MLKHDQLENDDDGILGLGVILSILKHLVHKPALEHNQPIPSVLPLVLVVPGLCHGHHMLLGHKLYLSGVVINGILCPGAEDTPAANDDA